MWHRNNELKSCSDGRCGAEDCPKCSPGCDRPVTCEGCGDETYACYADDFGYNTCLLCGGRFCDECSVEGVYTTIAGKRTFVCEGCIKGLIRDAARDKQHDDKDPADAG